ncbi:hypothetical protein BJY00DRAFT_318776 [Aspergillus carlsbadensis]|nr:hypothetical protein BJY00DRAFT_318776 [Aspergillus carlsbadensis]
MSEMPGTSPEFPAPTQGQPTPPSSPRKRRKHLRESEETAGTMTIEEYLHRADPYRTTTMKSPWPYPVAAAPAPAETVRLIEIHKGEILALLEAGGFSTSVKHFECRVEDISKPEYPMGSTPETMLRLMWSGDAPVPPQLEASRDVVANLLAQKGIDRVGVELVFSEKSFQPSMFSISPSHPAVPIYDAAKGEILTLVKDRLGNEWSLLSQFEMGRTEETATPTIVVLVNPLMTHDWADLATQIQRKLHAGDETATEMDVEFIPGGISFFDVPAADDAGTSCLWNTRADGVPTPGASIAVLPGRGIGSLGPFVTLTKGSRKWNSTCVGSSPALQTKTKFNVSFFAPSDAASTMEHIRANIEELSEFVEALEIEKTQREEFGAAQMHPKRAELIDLGKEHIAILEKKLQIISRMPIKLGRTLASSGRRVDGDKLIDWALIELSPGPFQQSEASFINRMPNVALSQRPYYPGNREPKADLTPEGYLLVEFGRLEKGQWYCKAGRTSGVTGGICGGASAYCNWPTTNRERWGKDGLQRAMLEDGVVTEAWVITTRNVDSSGVNQGTFCCNGDSGSGVVNDSGCICGLVYAGARALCGPGHQLWSGMCSDIQDVKRWVEEKVPGAVLGLPDSC